MISQPTRYLRLVSFFFLVVLAQSAKSQAFTNVAAANGIIMYEPLAPVLGIGLSTYDYDKDGWDDITFATKSDSIVIYHNMNGEGFERIEIGTAGTEGKQPLWVDYDNDGDADLLYTRRSSGTALYRNDGNMVFTNVTASLGLPVIPGTHIYGQAWADYDRDGWIDVYLCTYNTSLGIRNYLLHNNGDGTFTEVAIAAGIDNGITPTYQAIWQDFNADHWPDIYVINDSNFGNSLFLNNQNGTFTDITALSNTMGDNMDSMSSSICDFDNDGDWDIYVTDLPDGNSFFVNDGTNFFSDEAVALDITTDSWCWGSTWIDYDNDTDNDLHVTTATAISNNDVLYTNNGDGTFTNLLFDEFALESSFTYAGAKCDFDNNGYTDMAVFASNDSASMLLQNNGGTNHWLKFTLQGTYSNRDAVGTLIEYYLDGIAHRHYTRCGEDFLSQHSQHFILGLGDATQADSIIITWPRGLVEKWYDVAADQWLQLTEGENTFVNIVAENNAHICPGESITLDAGQWEQVLWSTDEETQTISVNEEGIYSVTVTDENGYTFNGEVEVFNALNPQAFAIADDISCWYMQDGMIAVTNQAGENISWQDNNNDFVRTDLAAGEYSYTVTNEWGCTTTGVEVIAAPDTITAVVFTTPASCYGGNDGTLNLMADGGTGALTSDYNGENPDALASGDHTAFVTDENQCVLEVNYSISQPDSIQANITTVGVSCYGLNDGSAEATANGGIGVLVVDWQGESPLSLYAGEYAISVTDENECASVFTYTITQPDSLVAEPLVTDALCFGDANGTCTLEIDGGTEPYIADFFGNDPDTLSAGTYTAVITDAHGCSAEVDFTISQPEELNATINHMDETATSDGWASVTPSGGTPPYEYLWNNNDTDSLAEELEEGDYTCLIQDANGCTFITQVEVLFDGINELDAMQIGVFPNPVNTSFSIMHAPAGCEVWLTDAMGRRVYSAFGVRLVDVSHLEEGVYVLHLSGVQYNASTRVVVER
ncbi:MAG: FG-GAP-like repeat-containing protein [Flavobacteriales bacterium]